MIVEYRATYSFPFEYLNAQVQIEMHIRLASPGEPGVDVAIDLPFDAFLDEHLQDIFDQFLSDAIHGGIAAVGQPLPQRGLKIEVVALRITPATVIEQEGKLVGEVMRIVELMVSNTVSTLFYTISTTSTRTTTRRRLSSKRKHV